MRPKPIKHTRLGSLLLLLFILGISGCTQAAPTPAPTPITAVDNAINPTEPPPATAEPSPTLPPTEPPASPTAEPATATPEPTAVPPTAEPTLPPVPQITELTVTNPLPSDVMIAAGENTIQGIVSPAAAVEVCAEIEMYGYGVLFECTTADANDGRWSLTTLLHPRATGRGQLVISSGETEVSVPVTLQYPEQTDEILVTFNQPNQETVLVPGKILLVDGSVRNAIDGKIRIGVYACDDQGNRGERYAGIEVDIVDGDWFAYTIPPETIGAEVVCVRVFTGVPFGSDDISPANWQWSDIIPVVQEADLSAPLIELGNQLQTSYPAGQTITLLGRVVGSVDNQLRAELRFTERQPIVGAVTVDDFGLWEATFELPEAGAREGMFLQLTAEGADGPVTVEYPLLLEP